MLLGHRCECYLDVGVFFREQSAVGEAAENEHDELEGKTDEERHETNSV